MSSPLPGGQYGVVQSKAETENRVIEALSERKPTTLDLQSDEASGQIHFRVRNLDHGDESDFVIGVTDDHRVLNLHLPHTGEVTANLA